MQVDYSRFFPYLIALLAVFLVYRRLRRSFGRQRIRPVRMGLRIGILLLLGASLLPAALKSGQFLSAELIGLTVGVGLAAWGAHRTRYEMHGTLHYIPHTYTGIAVSMLLVGRLVYRFVQMYATGHASGNALMQDYGSGGMMRSPVTAGSLFVVVGYYVCYYSAVLWKSKRISPEDLEGVSASMPASRNEGAASG